jgi:hypothetical protein
MLKLLSEVTRRPATSASLPDVVAHEGERTQQRVTHKIEEAAHVE